MKRFLTVALAMISCAMVSNAQSTIFTSQYDKLEWPGNGTLKGGIIGDDYNYSRLALYHGHSISLQTGSNTVDYAFTRLYINSSGNVGIGTTSPAFKLDVDGDIRARGGMESKGAIAGDHAFYSSYSNGVVFTNWLGISGVNPSAVNLLGSGNPHAGFGVADGDGVHSPVVWMYNNTNNAFRVRTMNYQGGMNSGNDLMVVRQNGKVGIGTSNPSTKLEVNGWGKFDSDAYSGDEIQFEPQNGFHRVAFNQLRLYEWGYGDRMTFKDGFIGIGTTNPTTHLEVDGGVNVKKNNVLSLGAEDRTTGHFKIATSSQYFNTYADFYGSLYFRRIGYDNTNTIQNLGALLGLQSDGTVTIGEWEHYSNTVTDTDGYKLMVNGGIVCKEVKVTEGVPFSDFVFEDCYELRPLEEVEAYIKDNKHLPEVPAAQEFVENGYSVGEMDDLLLRKVEELTLYVIELKKEIEELKSEK